MSFVNLVSSVAIQSVMKTMKSTQNGVDITGDLTLDGVSFLLKAYPVGAVYVSTIQTNPSGLIGGIWDRIEGKFLVGISDTDSTFADGATDIGKKEHTLTKAEIPPHIHTYADRFRNPQGGAGQIFNLASGSQVAVSSPTVNTGDGSPDLQGLAHNNLPPFLPVYIFKRTA